MNDEHPADSSDEASAKPARKRTPRPKPVEAAAEPAAEAEPEIAAEAGPEPEIVAEDAAQAEGSTGNPIEQAALAAVAGGPGGFAAPTEASVPSANGTSEAKPAVAPPPAAPSGALESAVPAARRLAPLAVLGVLVAFVLRRRRKKR